MFKDKAIAAFLRRDYQKYLMLSAMTYECKAYSLKLESLCDGLEDLEGLNFYNFALKFQVEAIGFLTNALFCWSKFFMNEAFAAEAEGNTDRYESFLRKSADYYTDYIKLRFRVISGEEGLRKALDYLNSWEPGMVFEG